MPNPVIRVPYPEWLHRRLLERDQTGRQRSITDMFALVALNKPRPKPLESAIAVSNASCDGTSLLLPLPRTEAIEVAIGTQDSSSVSSTPTASVVVDLAIPTTQEYDDDAEARAEGVDEEGGATAESQQPSEDGHNGADSTGVQHSASGGASAGTGTTRKRKSGVGIGSSSGRGKGRGSKGGDQPTLESTVDGTPRTLHGYIRHMHRSMLDSHWHIVQVLVLLYSYVDK